MNPDYFKRFFFYKVVVGNGEWYRARTLAILFSLFVLEFVACWHDGLLVLHGNAYGFLEDLAAYANVIANYFLIVFAVKLPLLYVRTFKGQGAGFDYDAGIFQSIQFNEKYTSREYESDFERYYALVTRQTNRSRFLFFTLMVGGILSNVYAEIGMYNSPLQSWAYQGTYLASFSAVTLLNMLIWWFVYPETVFLIVTTLIGLIRLSMKLSNKDAVVLSPVTRDDRGGFIALTRFCLHFVKLLFFPLIFLLSFICMNGFRTESVAALFLYIVLLVFTFFWPLEAIHKAMRKCRERELLKVESLFKKHYVRYQEMSRNGSSDQELDRLSVTLINIENLFNLTKRLPLWPYDWSLLTQFFSIIILPITAFLLEMASNATSLLEKLRGVRGLIEIFEKSGGNFDLFR